MLVKTRISEFNLSIGKTPMQVCLLVEGYLRIGETKGFPYAGKTRISEFNLSIGNIPDEFIPMLGEN